jgi:hypothetical protein
MRKYLAINLLILTLLLQCSLLAQNPESNEVPPPPNDLKTLRQYLSSAISSYQNGEVKRFARLIDALKLPNSESWLRLQFGQEEGSKLNVQYDRVFDAFRSRLADHAERLGQTPGELTLEGWKKQSRDVAPLYPAPTTRSKIAVESFKYVLNASGKGRSEWMDSYVLVNGYFRFVGQGAFPFWSGPLAIRMRKAP